MESYNWSQLKKGDLPAEIESDAKSVVDALFRKKSLMFAGCRVQGTGYPFGTDINKF